MNEPIHVSEAAFEKTVLRSSIPVLVDFWATWCGPCKMLMPFLEQAAKDYEGKLLIAKINADEDGELCSAYQVQNLPTLYLFKNGEIVGRHVGSMSKSALYDFIDENIA